MICFAQRVRRLGQVARHLGRHRDLLGGGNKVDQFRVVPTRSAVNRKDLTPPGTSKISVERNGQGWTGSFSRGLLAAQASHHVAASLRQRFVISTEFRFLKTTPAILHVHRSLT